MSVPLPSHLAHRERVFRALRTWYETSDMERVRQAIGAETIEEAEVAVRQGSEAFDAQFVREIQSARVESIARLRMLLDKLQGHINATEGPTLSRTDLAVMDRVVTVLDKIAARTGVDAPAKSAPSVVILTGGDAHIQPAAQQPDAQVFDTRPPWERDAPQLPAGDVIDGEVTEDA